MKDKHKQLDAYERDYNDNTFNNDNTFVRDCWIQLLYTYKSISMNSWIFRA